MNILEHNKIYSFPKDKAATIAIEAILNFYKEHTIIKKVIFVCFDEENFKIYENLLRK